MDLAQALIGSCKFNCARLASLYSIFVLLTACNADPKLRVTSYKDDDEVGSRYLQNRFHESNIKYLQSIKNKNSNSITSENERQEAILDKLKRIEDDGINLRKRNNRGASSYIEEPSAFSFGVDLNIRIDDYRR